MAVFIIYQCLSCGGVYRPFQADGTAYFHVCPPGTTNPRNENIVQTTAGGPVSIISAGGGYIQLD
jgi:hypothetical protein